MAEHEININLNDAARQTFDNQGNQTGSSGIPLADPSVFQAYQAMVDRFEEVISNAPEAVADRQRREDADSMTTFFPKEDVREFGKIRPADEVEDEPETETRPSRRRRPRRGNAPENNARDPIEEYIIDRMTEEPTPPGGGGGSGVNPNSPTGGAPGGNAFPPPTPPGGGPTPPTPPGGSPGGPGGPGDTAGAAAILGPIGVGVIAGIGLIESLILVGEGIVASIDALDDTMKSVVEDIKAFSPEVAQATAASGIADLMIKMDRAEEIGADMARWIETRTEIDMVLGRTATEFVRDFLPLIQKGTEGILDIVTLLSLLSEDAKGMVDFVIQGNPFTNVLEMTGLLDYIKQIANAAHIGVKLAREQKLKDLEAKAATVGDNFQKWLEFEALPAANNMQLVERQLRLRPAVNGGGR